MSASSGLLKVGFWGPYRAIGNQIGLCKTNKNHVTPYRNKTILDIFGPYGTNQDYLGPIGKTQDQQDHTEKLLTICDPAGPCLTIQYHRGPLYIMRTMQYHGRLWDPRRL